MIARCPTASRVSKSTRASPDACANTSASSSNRSWTTVDPLHVATVAAAASRRARMPAVPAATCVVAKTALPTAVFRYGDRAAALPEPPEGDNKPHEIRPGLFAPLTMSAPPAGSAVHFRSANFVVFLCDEWHWSADSASARKYTRCRCRRSASSTAGGELLQSELADRLQHREARLGLRPVDPAAPDSDRPGLRAQRQRRDPPPHTDSAASREKSPTKTDRRRKSALSPGGSKS